MLSRVTIELVVLFNVVCHHWDLWPHHPMSWPSLKHYGSHYYLSWVLTVPCRHWTWGLPFFVTLIPDWVGESEVTLSGLSTFVRWRRQVGSVTPPCRVGSETKGLTFRGVVSPRSPMDQVEKTWSETYRLSRLRYTRVRGHSVDEGTRLRD